jgi:hypothetical protein
MRPAIPALCMPTVMTTRVIAASSSALANASQVGNGLRGGLDRSAVSPYLGVRIRIASRANVFTVDQRGTIHDKATR